MDFQSIVVDLPPNRSPTVSTKDNCTDIQEAIKAAKEKGCVGEMAPTSLEAQELEWGSTSLETCLDEMSEVHHEYGKIFAMATEAGKKFRESPEGQAKMAALKSQADGQALSEDCQKLAFELLTGPEFAPVLASASTTTGVVAFGIGLVGTAGFIKGVDGGADGIIVFPQSSGGSSTNTKFVTRTWTDKAAIELGVDAGLNFSLWFQAPITATIAGLFVNLAAGAGLRFTAFGQLLNTGLKEASKQKMPHPTVYTLAPEVGISLGFGAFKGKQTTGLERSLSTLEVLNEDTESAVVLIGIENTLTATITPPDDGVSPSRSFKSGTSELSLNLPTYLSDNIESITVTGPDDWTLTSQTDGKIVFSYTGSDASWQSNLIIGLANVESNSTITEDTKGAVKVGLTGTESTYQYDTTYVPILPVSLEATLLAFTAIISDWSVAVDSDFTILGDSSGSNASAVTPPNEFVQLTSVVDADGDTWNLGYAYEQIDSDSYMQAIWWKDGTSYVARNLFTSDKIMVSDDSQTIQAYYNDIKGSNVFSITVALP